MIRRLSVTLLVSGLLVGCFGTNKDKTPEQIKNELQSAIPGLTKIDAVDKSPVNGLYEVAIGRRVFYTTTDGKYLVFGNVIDTENKQSITEARVQELSKIDWNKLPLNLALKEVNGDGSRKLVVFADPECPYCQQFEKSIAPNLANTTIYTFLFPLPQHPHAKQWSQQLWCNKTNRDQAWVNWMRNGIAITGDANCKEATTDLAEVYKVANDVVEVDATPTLILANGQILSGALPADELTAAMDKAAGVNTKAQASAATTTK